MKALMMATALCFMAAIPASAQIMEMNGTWELNTDRTLGPSPVQETLVFHISEGIQSYVMTSVDADGQKGLNEWSIQYDGHEHATQTEGNTASVRRLGAKTELVINKRNGHVTSTYTRVLVDNDMTIMSVGRNADGEVIWVRVFEKQ
jgi:hypothetical protein